MLIDNDIKVKNTNVLVLGLTFKEDCPDLRNSKVVDIIEGLRSYGMSVTILDPVADKEEAKREYELEILNSLEENLENYDVIIGAVKHKEFNKIKIEELYKGEQEKILLDLKGIFNKKEVENKYVYWRM
mgnify:CR=1 FL=1